MRVGILKITNLITRHHVLATVSQGWTSSITLKNYIELSLEYLYWRTFKIQDQPFFCKWNHFSLRLIKCIPWTFGTIQQYSTKLTQYKLLQNFLYCHSGKFRVVHVQFQKSLLFLFLGGWDKLNLYLCHGRARLLIAISTAKSSLLNFFWLPHRQL